MQDDERLIINHGVAVGAPLEGVACVTRLVEKVTRRGDPMLDIEIGNRTGRIRNVAWKEQMDLWNGIAPGDAVYVSGTADEAYRNEGRRELKVDRVSKLAEDHPIRLEINPESPVPEAELRRRYDEMRSSLRYSSIEILDAILHGDTERAYWEAPAAATFHHAYIGGLAEHSIEVAELALRMGAQDQWREWLDPDLLCLAGLLHDVGKVKEYRWKGEPIRYVEGLTSHTCSGQQMISQAVHERVPELAGADKRLLKLLLHIVESHHATAEHGSPTPPRCPEAWLIHTADLTSARVNPMVQTLAEVPTDGSGWRRPDEWGRDPVVESGTANGDLCWRSFRRVVDPAQSHDHWTEWIEDYDALGMTGQGLL